MEDHVEVNVVKCGGTIALLSKLPGGRERVVATAEPGQSVKEMIWQEVQKLAAVARDRDPTLSKEQATVAAMDSDQGRPLMAIYRSGDSHLTAAEWTEKQHAPARPRAARREIMKISDSIRAKNPKISDSAAFIQALDCDPELAKRYRAERERV